MRAFIVVAIVSMLAGCGGSARKPVRVAYDAQTMGEPVGRVAAAGDIACAPSDPSFHEGFGTSARCRMRATSDVLLTARPTAVLTLGDNQYERGRLSDFSPVVQNSAKPQRIFL